MDAKLSGNNSKSNIRISKNGRIQINDPNNLGQYSTVMQYEQKERAASYGPLQNIQTSQYRKKSRKGYREQGLPMIGGGQFNQQNGIHEYQNNNHPFNQKHIIKMEKNINSQIPTKNKQVI